MRWEVSLPDIIISNYNYIDDKTICENNVEIEAYKYSILTASLKYFERKQVNKMKTIVKVNAFDIIKFFYSTRHLLLI